MRKYIPFILAVVAVFVFCLPLSAKKNQASVRFAEQTYNFGNVKENGGPVSHNFEFVNEGDGNLVIVDATSQCGCTKPEYPAKPIAPGKRGVVKVTYNPTGRPGPFDKVITVKTNAKNKKVRLKITGNVIPSKK